MDTFAKEKIQALDKAVESASSVVILTHAHPDGDAFGSSIALKHYLSEKRGKDVKICIADPLISSLRFLYEGEEISTSFEDAPLLFCVDANSFTRAEYMSEMALSSKAFKVLVDHHLNPAESEFDLVFSCAETSSACEVLYSVLLSLPDVKSVRDLPEKSRFALMAGLTTDTNNFANSVYPGTFRMASDLLESGVDRNAIISNLYNSYRRNRVDALSFMLNRRLHITPKGCAYMIMEEWVRRKFDLQEGETEGLVNIPLSIKDVKMSVFLRQDSGHFRVSIRSKEGVYANRFAARYFNGGGHELASGGKLYYPGDIRTKSDAAGYIEKVSEEFL